MFVLFHSSINEVITVTPVFVSYTNLKPHNGLYHNSRGDGLFCFTFNIILY